MQILVISRRNDGFIAFIKCVEHFNFRIEKSSIEMKGFTNSVKRNPKMLAARIHMASFDF